MKTLLFAGTSEGRELAGRLAGTSIDLTLSVASDYGREALLGLPERFAVLVGRLDRPAMARLLRDGGYDLVVDATHPYAGLASETIRAAAAEAGVDRIRVERAGSAAPGCEFFPSAAAAAARLTELGGRIFIATGLKDLAEFTVVPDYAERIYLRVLPTGEAIARCESLGFRRSHVVAMQGPFGRELNRAIMRHFGIAVLLTKDGGEAGGFGDKVAAAGDVGARILVLGRPAGGAGLPLDSAYREILARLEATA